MFLISKFVYEAMGKSKHHEQTPYIKIHDYLSSNHKQTFYKFRYGAPDLGGAYSTPKSLELKPSSTAAIWSLEGFELSERVLAVFGHASDLFLRGLELIHSPFIDPRFTGRLQLVVRNYSTSEVTLSPGEIIGKITFFDISDTILSADDLLSEVQQNAQNQVREQALQALSRAMYPKSKE